MFEEEEKAMREDESPSCVVDRSSSSGAFQVALLVHRNLYEVLGRDDGPAM